MKTVISLVIAYVVALIIALTGYIANIVWLFKATGEATTEFYVALAGLFVPPVGIIHGYLTIF